MHIDHKILIAAIASALSLAASPLPYSDPYNAGNWALNPAVSDEFDGDQLDLEKWQLLGLDGNYYGRWKGRAPSQFAPENVSVGDGYLTITSKWEPDFEFIDERFKNGYKYGEYAPITTGSIISKAKFKYGYMEMRCRAADGPISSAFWTTGVGGEIDVFEHYGEHPSKPFAATRLHTSFHDWRKGSPTFSKRIWTNDHQLDFRVADDFNVYGLEWAPSFLKIYVNGQLIKCITKEAIGDAWVADNEQMIWIDSETFDWEVKPETMTAEDFGDGQRFVVDYCRIWQRETPGGGCEAQHNHVVNAGFEAGLNHWDGEVQLTTDEHGDTHATFKPGDTLEQRVTLKPNTTYVLSASAQTNKAEHKNVWLKQVVGIKNYGGEARHTQLIFPYPHQRSVQFTTGDTNTSATIYLSNASYGQTALVDDVTLVEALSPPAQ